MQSSSSAHAARSFSAGADDKEISSRSESQADHAALWHYSFVGHVTIAPLTARASVAAYKAEIDGRVESDIRVSRTIDQTFYLEAFLPAAVDVLLRCAATDFDPNVATVAVRSLIDESLHIFSASFELHRRELQLRFRFDPERWVGLWPLVQYLTEMERLFRERGLVWVTSYGELPHAYHLTFPYGDASAPLGGVLEMALCETRRIDALARRNLFSLVRPGSLLLEFQFPEETRAACQQYLVFFGEFMRDLGVAVRTEVIDEAERLLFAVTPANKQESLERIKAALDVYLALPNGMPSAGVGSDVLVSKLTANIHHLQGQLELARAVTSMQRSTIRAQEAAIEAQARSMAGAVTYDSLASEDREELVPDLISIRPVEAYGVQIDLPAIVRRLRQIFRKE